MQGLPPGLYELILTDELVQQLEATIDTALVSTTPLATAEAPDRIAWQIAQQIEHSLRGVDENRRADIGVEIGRALIGKLNEILGADVASPAARPATVLRAINEQRPDGGAATRNEPLTPLLDTTLLTNAPGEPGLWSQLRSEIDSADRIDVVMAFVRRSGIRPLLDALRDHCSDGRQLRILTTTYTGSTEQKALDDLAQLGADVRVSYDTGTTRLHAKAWAFHRNSGFSTAFVGSSNLTHSAQVTGLEWNVRISESRNPDVVNKVQAVFETYWNGGDFHPYDPEQFAEQMGRNEGTDSGPLILLSPIELHPLPFQQRLLELIDVSRRRGHHRNLLVAATGTGKTVMAALDYARLRQRLPRSRLLFVAHREELLDQSLATFRYALRDPTFGEKWVGGKRPERFEHVFASIQSISASGLSENATDHFDVVIIDEFHHAAAKSYERVLGHLQPTELLGLTATPERSDGLPILHWFDDRIAAELRLWDAIDQQLLVPFLYYGVHDGADLTGVPWRRGQGYDTAELSKVYTSSDAWARLVVSQVAEHCDLQSMRALGFCVSIAHAQFLADRFSYHGIPSVAVWGDSPRLEREQALRDLANGVIKVVFSVDLFNEGVDVPNVDTVMMLRPTESPVLFLQQLGRGLRRAPGKDSCTVLDFIGTHRKEFRFDRRYRALLGGSRRDLETAVVEKFPFLPVGCSIQLDNVASEIVLRSVREAIPSRWPAKVDELRSLRRDKPDIDLAGYLDETGLDLEDLYSTSRCWSDLLEAAGGTVGRSGPSEKVLRRAIGRLLHVNDAERLNTYSYFARSGAPEVTSLSERHGRLLRMLVASLADQAISSRTSLQDAVDLVWAHPQVLAELAELIDELKRRIDHLHEPLTSHPDVPLQVHARYSRIEILAAMGVGGAQAKVASWQSGVYEVKDAGADLLTITLDKNTGSFSPTTRYRDYAISPSLIHWESQSATRADSHTGLRYRNHESLQRSILLFARLDASDRSFWFLGPASYRGHVGERPMAITWELTVPLPGDLFSSFAAAAI